jgi:hypothetical protein
MFLIFMEMYKTCAGQRLWYREREAETKWQVWRNAPGVWEPKAGCDEFCRTKTLELVEEEERVGTCES